MSHASKHADRVNILKYVKVSGRWRFATLVEQDEEIIPDLVWIEKSMEYHPEGRYYLEWYQAGRRHRTAVPDAENIEDAARRKFLVLKSAASPTDVGDSFKGMAACGDNVSLTLDDAIRRYLEIIELHRSLGTFRSYRHALAALRESCHKTYVDELNRGDILDFMVSCYGRGYCNRTVLNKLVIAVQFLSFSGRPRLVQSSDWPEYLERLCPIYEPEEIEAMLRHADDDERVLLKFLLASGFRDREVKYLLWSDIDFRNCIARVTEKPRWRFTPKNWEERAVPLPSRLIEELREQKNRRKDQATYLVFPNSKGNPNAAQIMIVKRIAERSGLNCGRCTTKHGNNCSQGPYCQRFYLRKFRHTFATEHLRNGIDICTVQRWMGHRDIQSTMVYLRAFEPKEMLDKVNAGSLAEYVNLVK